MLFDVSLWFTLAHFPVPDRAYRVDASSVEDAALRALRLSGVAMAAYASVFAVTPVSGVVARSWGPVTLEVC